MDDNSLMPFGKFKGTPLANVPAKYLIWLHYNGVVYGDLKEYLKDNIDALHAECNTDYYKIKQQQAILDKEFQRRLDNND